MPLDPQQFPRACAYLSRLPAGIDSYPECQVRVDGRHNLVRDFAELAGTTGMPSPVRAFLEGEVRETWMPEVISVTALSMARDALLADDDALRAWAFRDATDVFEAPLNKVLMKLLSPTLVVMGAAKRWNHWRVGSTLTAEPVRQHQGRHETEMVLRYPENLYDQISLVQFGQVFVAATVASQGKNPRLELEPITSSSARFLVSWGR